MGLTPIHQADLSPRCAAAGFNVNIPLFNGHLYGALRGEADAQARAQEEDLRAKQIEIVKDVTARVAEREFRLSAAGAHE